MFWIDYCSCMCIRPVLWWAFFRMIESTFHRQTIDGFLFIYIHRIRSQQGKLSGMVRLSVCLLPFRQSFLMVLVSCPFVPGREIVMETILKAHLAKSHLIWCFPLLVLFRFFYFAFFAPTLLCSHSSYCSSFFIHPTRVAPGILTFSYKDSLYPYNLYSTLHLLSRNPSC